MSLLNEMGKIAIVQKPLSMGPMITQIQRAYRTHVKQDLSTKIKYEILEKLDKDGDFKSAIKQAKEFEEALDDMFYPLVLDLYQRAESFEDGLELVAKIPQSKLDPLQRLNLMGKFNLKLGNLDKARKFFEEADNIAPKNIDRITEMVDMYIQLKNPDSAVQKQKEILAVNPEEPDKKFDMFKQLEEGGFGEEAASFCRETSGPKEVVRYFNNKGVVMAQTNDLDVAIVEYQRALNYYPKNKNNYLIHFNLALAYLRKKDVSLFPHAKEHLTICLELEPEYSKAQELLKKIADKVAS